MKVYDASALFEKIGDRKKLDLSAFVLDLTIYEFGNVVLKHGKKLGKIGEVEAEALLRIISNWKNFIYVNRRDIGGIYQIAGKTELTFYDAAYVFYAKKYGATLETCDKQMHSRAKNECKIELIKWISR